MKAARTGSYSEAGSERLEVIGLYSTQHRGIFTHHDSDIHLHVIDREGPHTGHVDELELLPGTQIRLAESN